MARSSGTYTAPSNGFNPAINGEAIDPDDWNTTIQDVEDALTESVYTSGLGSTDNAVVRVDGTDGKKVQASGVTIDDDEVVSGVTLLGFDVVTVANLPSGSTGRMAYASDGRKNGEGVGSGTGVLVFHDGTAWRACDTGATVAA
jgi:hypothetical protein